MSLARDPLAAAAQLQEIAFAHAPSGPIEAEHEQARLAYRADHARPLTEPEQRLVDLLAALPSPRRDKIIDAAEQPARPRDGLPTHSHISADEDCTQP